MKKEVVLAIALGFGLGLIITFGIWTANKSLKKIKEQKTEVSTQVLPTPEISNAPKPEEFSLTLDTPENESISNKDTIVVTGKTSPAATVVIVFEDDEIITTANESGSFSQEIDLIGVYNTIVITAFDKDGNAASDSRVVTYTTAKI